MIGAPGPGPDLTVEKRILLHLHKYSRTYQDAWEVPNAMSQEGISEALDILLNNVSRAMKDLKSEGKVTERLAHIKGGRRKRRAYFLTEEGSRLAEEIRKSIIENEVPYVDKEGNASRLSVAKVLGQFNLDFGNTLAPTDVLETVRRNGSFDSAKVDASLKAAVAEEGKAPALVDMTDSAPRLARFVGRAGILAQIEANIDGDGPPILVVHGMAGIGKTTLALKVMEDLRGTKNLFYYRFHSWDSLGNVSVPLQELMVRMGIRSKALGPTGEFGINEQALLLARELGTRPVLLVFDDLHKARDDVLPLFRVLADLSGQFSGLRILLLTRTVPGFYSRKEVTVDKVVREVQLDGLDLDETKALVGDTIGEKALARIHGLSKGVPLFIEILSGVDNVDAIGDVRKYIEEEIYSSLASGERTILEELPQISGHAGGRSDRGFHLRRSFRPLPKVPRHGAAAQKVRGPRPHQGVRVWTVISRCKEEMPRQGSGVLPIATGPEPRRGRGRGGGIVLFPVAGNARGRPSHEAVRGRQGRRDAAVKDRT